MVYWFTVTGTIVTIPSTLYSGVGSNCGLRGPQIQVVGVALSIEFCDHNIPFPKSRILVIWKV